MDPASAIGKALRQPATLGPELSRKLRRAFDEKPNLPASTITPAERPFKASLVLRFANILFEPVWNRTFRRTTCRSPSPKAPGAGHREHRHDGRRLPAATCSKTTRFGCLRHRAETPAGFPGRHVSVGESGRSLARRPAPDGCRHRSDKPSAGQYAPGAADRESRSGVSKNPTSPAASRDRRPTSP